MEKVNACPVGGHQDVSLTLQLTLDLGLHSLPPQLTSSWSLAPTTAS